MKPGDVDEAIGAKESSNLEGIRVGDEGSFTITKPSLGNGVDGGASESEGRRKGFVKGIEERERIRGCCTCTKHGLHTLNTDEDGNPREEDQVHKRIDRW